MQRVSHEELAPRSFRERIARAIAWRAAGMRSRWRDRFPPFFPVVRELRAVTGKSSAAITAELLGTWIRRGWPATKFANLMLWDTPRERHDDYLSSKEIDPFLLRLLHPDDRTFGRDKIACAEHARERGIPWIPTLAVVNRHEGSPATDAIVVERPRDLWPTLDALIARGPLVLKPSNGLQGRGFYAVLGSGGGVVDAGGRPVARDELMRSVFEYNREGTAFGYVVQPLLRAHPAMVELTGVEALATVRMVTVRHESRNFTLQSLLKIPAPGHFTDNFRGGVSGTFIAGVSPSDGRLTDLVGLTRPDHRYVIERTPTHPATGKRLGGMELPYWRECFRVADLAAAAHPKSPVFAWDIGLGPEGWRVLEANALWGPTGYQICTRQGLRPLLSKLYPADWA
jgi:hypothetical protein